MKDKTFENLKIEEVMAFKGKLTQCYPSQRIAQLQLMLNDNITCPSCRKL